MYLLIFHNILFAIHIPAHLNSELNTVVFCCQNLYNVFIVCNSETTDGILYVFVLLLSLTEV